MAVPLYIHKRIIMLLLFCTCLAAQSQTVGNWPFSNTMNGSGSTYNSVASAVFGAGVPTTAFNGGGEGFGENGWPAGGLNTSTYIEFSITPHTSYELNLTDVVLRMRRSNTGSPAGSGPRQWSLRSSRDGFAANIASGSLTHNYSNYTVPLTGFYHVPVTVTFRLYGYSATVGSGGISRLVFDNISIQGLMGVLAIVPPVVRNREVNKTSIVVNGSSIVANIHSSKDEQYMLFVHASNGALLQKRALYVKAGNNRMLLISDGLPHGVYTITLAGKEKRSSKQVMY